MFDIHHVPVTKYDENGFLGVQLLTDDPEETFMAESTFPLGWVARPDDCEPGKPGPVAIGFEDGSDVHAVLLTDARVMSAQPKVKPGGFAFYAPTTRLQTFLACNGDNGSLTLYTKDGAGAHALNIDTTTHTWYLQQKDGAAILIPPEGPLLRAPDGSASLQVLNGLVQTIGGLAITGSLSQVGGLPVVPLPQFLAFATALLTTLAEYEAKFALIGPVAAPGTYTIVATAAGTVGPAAAAVLGTVQAALL